MDERPIGVFDSGLGGLTSVKELEKTLPGESIVFFGDTGRAPYGTKDRETLRRYAAEDMRFLMARGVKAILAACGTVSSTAADLGAALPVPYFDVVSPAARAAARATRSGRVGVIGTSATIHSGAYRKALLRENAELQVFSQACPLFVALVENAFIAPQDAVTRLVAERYLAPIREAGVDTLILGCTHFPIIAPIIQSVMGRDVTLVDSGQQASLALAEALRERDLLCGPGHRRTAHYFVTDMPEGFVSVAELFLGHSVEGETRRVHVEDLSAGAQG